MNSFYNTTSETGPALKESEQKAKNQEEKVLAFFEEAAGHCFGPSTIHAEVLPTVPLTSVRRAITNLTKAGKLLKTTHQRIGVYGKNEYLWCLNERPE